MKSNISAVFFKVLQYVREGLVESLLLSNFFIVEKFVTIMYKVDLDSFFLSTFKKPIIKKVSKYL